MMTKAAERYNLTEVARVVIEGREWVVYSEGHGGGGGRYAIHAADWSDADLVTGNDYSRWCADTHGAGDPDLVRRIARAAGLDELRACGTDLLVSAL